MKKPWGVCGMVLIQICYFPQLLKVIQTREVAGISALMYGVLICGLVCYLIYAIKIRDWIYILSNTINLVSAGLLFYLILLWG